MTSFALDVSHTHDLNAAWGFRPLWLNASRLHKYATVVLTVFASIHTHPFPVSSV